MASPRASPRAAVSDIYNTDSEDSEEENDLHGDFLRSLSLSLSLSLSDLSLGSLSDLSSCLISLVASSRAAPPPHSYAPGVMTLSCVVNAGAPSEMIKCIRRTRVDSFASVFSHTTDPEKFQ